MFRKRKTQKPGEAFYSSFKQNYLNFFKASVFSMDRRGGSSGHGNHGPGDYMNNSFLNQPNKLEAQASQLLTSSAEEIDSVFNATALRPGDSTEHIGGYDPFLSPPGLADYHGHNTRGFQSDFTFPPGSSSISHTNEMQPSSLMHSGMFSMPSFGFYDVQSGYNHPVGMPPSFMTPGAPNINPNKISAPRAASKELGQTSYIQPHSLTTTRSGDHSDQWTSHDIPTNISNRRYLITLSAPTAMVKHFNDIPVTYLNKSQTYLITIKDLHGQTEPIPPRKYRTAVRISFEDEQQRAKPEAAWALWKDGRGRNESYKRGGKLLAVEYVPPEETFPHASRVDLVQVEEHFDGFIVEWSPPVGKHECVLQARFHFLSTDFSHSKGVKGIPVRLCAKTEAVDPFDPTVPSPTKQILYCKVKTFRDHGAERKIANDKQHVNKNIEKLKQQKDQQAEASAKSGLKRRRSDSVSAARPPKAPKHQRSHSASTIMSQDDDTPDGDEDGIDYKLGNLEHALTTIRQTSVLDLEGDDVDDLDNFPVPLADPASGPKPDDNSTGLYGMQDLARVSEKPSTVTPSSTSWSPSMSRKTNPALQYPTPFGATPRTSSNDGQIRDPFSIHLKTEPRQPENVVTTSEQPVTIKSSRRRSGNPTPWLEAIHVDNSYVAPPSPVVKPVACFYVKLSIPWRRADDYYRAVYLMNRSVKDLVEAIAQKCDVNATQIIDTIRVNSRNQQIKVEDEMVEHMNEGQDLIAEFDMTNRTHESSEEFMLTHDINDDEETGSELEQSYRLTLCF